ncbi:unnamed protein product [Effrenium voratum]|nr:unnamed protein product [Effrenium voratum]
MSAAPWLSAADMYLNSPRGSNNKLREQSNNVQNANRLFDSQNNAAAGYQIGDDCKPACKDGDNNYDVTVEGATKGTMKFYQGSELYVEWTHQHGCGVGHPNLRCQIILQYMSEEDTSRLLQLQAVGWGAGEVNTNQFGRTFEDRTHSFLVLERPANVPQAQRIVNFNVRGRRGNIVQVYPAVEYDFVPQDLKVEQGTLLHFQWTGSDANNNNNAGNGRAGTDRSNLVQVQSRSETVPLPLSKHTLLFNALANPDDPEGRRLADKFAYLGQDSIVTCDPDTNNQNSETNCKQLNGASAYFDGGLVEMKTVGTHHIASTRNNDFSNRSHKAQITVTRFSLEIYENIAVGVGGFCFLVLFIYVCCAIHACRRPGSWLFSRRYRPRLLHWVLRKATMERLLEERRQLVAKQRKEWAKKANAHAADEEGADVGAAEVALPEEQVTWFQGLTRCFRKCGFGEQQLTTFMFGVLNVLVFAIGFLSNLSGGFQKSWAFPIAKGGGYSMDLNFALLILPTLKSLQTTMRRVSSSREWVPIDDPINFHIVIASFTMLGAFVHIAGHCVHMYLIRTAPLIQLDPLQLWDLTPQEKMSGMTLWQQVLNIQIRCAGLTGIILTFMMVAILLTAVSCSRRGTNCLTRRFFGFNLFWRIHMSWKWIYVLLLLHAPARLWIWFFFPFIFVVVDRMLLANNQALNLSLKSVKLLPRDVIGLTFELPQGFAYQANRFDRIRDLVRGGRKREILVISGTAWGKIVFLGFSFEGIILNWLSLFWARLRTFERNRVV